MRLPCIRSTFALLVLETIQFREHIDGNKDVIVLKPVQAIGVMQKNIGIQNEVFDSSRSAGAVG